LLSANFNKFSGKPYILDFFDNQSKNNFFVSISLSLTVICREPSRDQFTTSIEEQCNFNDRIWCITSCALKSLSPTDFIISFLKVFPAVSFPERFFITEVNAFMATSDIFTAFEAYLAIQTCIVI